MKLTRQFALSAAVLSALLAAVAALGGAIR
jgi:hypothetical protein